jgi:hypothetical protein
VKNHKINSKSINSLTKFNSYEKTIKIKIKCEVETDEFVISNLMSYENFVIETCPNFTTLHFALTSLMPRANATCYFDKLNTLLNSFMNEPLVNGNSELKICLTWTGTCELRDNDDVSKELEGDEFIIYKRSCLRLFHKTMSFSPLVQNTRLSEKAIIQPAIARIIKARWLMQKGANVSAS